jgi:hypothetical protein
VKLRNGDKAAQTAFANLQAAVTAGDNTGAVAAYNTLKVVIGTVQSLLVVSGATTL